MTQVFLPIQPTPACCAYALLHRAGVDVRPRVERLRRLLAHPGQQRLESSGNHVVIVVAPGVPRDVRVPRIGGLGRIRAIRVVNGRRRDHGAGRRQNMPDIAAALGGSVEIAHLAGPAALEPFIQEAQLGMIGGRRDAAGIETELGSLCLDC